MRRAVLDPGVFTSALITPGGTPSRLVRMANEGEFELITSPALITELRDVLHREKFRRYVDLDAVRDYVDVLRRVSTAVTDPAIPPPLRSSDPDDDYLITLAAEHNADLVSGDAHLLDLNAQAPIYRPAEYLALVEST